MIKENKLDSSHLNLIENMDFSPIFIMGLHRSGTSILYKMLGGTKKLNIVTAYHILKYDELIYNHINNLEKDKKEELNEVFKSKGIINRKIDRIKVSADYAHEYVYVYSKKNMSDKTSLENIDLLKQLCQKIMFISENHYPLLLKNPYDYPNFLFIKKHFPNAKFIFINRNPLAVISSTMRAWKKLLEKKNLYTAMFSKKYNKTYENPILLALNRLYYTGFFPIGVFDIINRASKETSFYLNNINRLNDNDYVSITYESLCNKTDKTMDKILDFLDIKPHVDFKNYVKPRNLNLISEVKFLREYIYKKMISYFDEFGYTMFPKKCDDKI
jgi:hypothetical protein